MAYKIGILTTHPIQYKVPWYQALSKHSDIDLTVFYCILPDARLQGDGFDRDFKWDIPLLDGYKYEILENIAKEPSLTRFSGCDTPGIIRIVEKRYFDVFIVNGWVVKSCLQLLYACRKYRVPCIVRGESNSLRYRVWWKRLIHRLLLRQYSAFISIGTANKNFYLRNGVPKKKIFPGSYCVDNNRFSAQSKILRPERDIFREEWGIHKDAMVFLFCAKFIEKKKPVDLLRAFSKVTDICRKKDYLVHLLMVGDGELLEKCKKTALNNNLPVTFTGFLNQREIIKSYVVSDCLVLPSDYGETWGLVVNEAMACGLPVIVSNRVGCHSDLVKQNETGAIFSFGNYYELSDILIHYTENPEMVKKMGIKAEKLIKEYSIDNLVNGTINAVQYALTRIVHFRV